MFLIVGTFPLALYGPELGDSVVPRGGEVELYLPAGYPYFEYSSNILRVGNSSILIVPLPYFSLLPIVIL